MNKKDTTLQYSFEDVFNKPGNCDQTENLYQYFQASLSKEDEEGFERHLSECHDCAHSLTELNETEMVSRNTILDTETSDRIFQQNRVQFEDQLNQKLGIDTPPRFGSTAGTAVLQRFRFPVYANAMLVVIIGLLIYPAYRSFVLDREVTRLHQELAGQSQQQPVQNPEPAPVPQVSESPEPLLSPALVFPVRPERDAEEKTIRIPFNKGTQNFSVLFSLPGDSFERYLLEIDQEHRIVWQKELAAIQGETSQLTSITFHSSTFQKGEYRLKISGVRSEKSTELSIFKLIISYQ